MVKIKKLEDNTNLSGMCPPTDTYEMKISYKSSVRIEYFKPRDWRQQILQGLINLCPTVEFRIVKEEIDLLQNFLETYDVKFTDCVTFLEIAKNHEKLTDNEFFSRVVNAFFDMLDTSYDNGLNALDEEIKLCENDITVMVMIYADKTQQRHILECTDVSIGPVLKKTWLAIKNTMLEMYPGKSIHVFVPEAIRSSFFPDKGLQNILDDEGGFENLVEQSDADDTWKWLLDNGFDYCGYFTHDPPCSERVCKDAYGTPNNYCPYFIYKHKS
jgi:hypothetical protein